MSNNFSTLVSFLLMILLSACGTREISMQTINIKQATEMQDFFAYKNDGSIIISGHRGGMLVGYPENSIEAMGKTLQHLPAFFEIDPRLTKDSVIVLMHDADISRTTTGEGLLSSYTWEELKEFKLLDMQGNITPYHIPSLEEAITWSKGKTVLNIDKKDVPLDMMAAFLKKLNPSNVMITVHTPEQALYYYEQDNDVMFSAFIRNMDEFKGYEKTNIPWSQFIAYVGPTLKDENRELYELLHKKGVRYMISLAPNHDKVKDVKERNTLYKESIKTSPDIIESDFPIDLYNAKQNIN